jgi:hypothetical protein
MRRRGYSSLQAVDGAKTFTASQLFASQMSKWSTAAPTNEKRVDTCANSLSLQRPGNFGSNGLYYRLVPPLGAGRKLQSRTRRVDI